MSSFNKNTLTVFFFCVLATSIIFPIYNYWNDIFIFKYLYFNAIISVFCIIGLILINTRIKTKLHYNTLDFIVFAFFLFVLGNQLVKVNKFDEQILSFAYLPIMYIIVKQVFSNSEETLKNNFIIAFLLFAIVQSLIIFLQLLGYLPSYSAFFKLSGTFYNPAPCAVYLSTFLPFSIGLYLFSPNNNKKTGYCKFALITSIAILLVLPQTGSRTAMLSSLFGISFLLIHKFSIVKRITELSAYLKITLLVFVISVLFVSGFFIYKVKEDSAFGRLVIWKVSRNMISESPVTGLGYEGVKGEYNKHQAAYFSGNSNVKEIQVASQVKYIYNDYLQLLIEEGIVGFSLFAIVIIFALMGFKRIQKVNSESSSYYIAAYASFLSVLFSMITFYSLENLPITINFMFFIGLISAYNSNHVITINKNIATISLSLILITFFIIFGIKQIKIYNAINLCIDAKKDILNNKYSEADKLYSKASNNLNNSFNFQLERGKFLALSGRHSESIFLLEKLSKITYDTSLFRSLGDSYVRIGKFNNAERSYLNCSYIVPNKFDPYYKLARLYKLENDTQKTIQMARYIISKPIKVKSELVTSMKNEMNDLTLSLSEK